MEIQLNGKYGGSTLVSTEDYEKVSQYKWNKTKDGYVCGRVNGKVVKMHRFIMDEPKGLIVDHKDRVRTNNQKENLRM